MRVPTCRFPAHGCCELLILIVTPADRLVVAAVSGSEPLVVYCQKCGVEVDTLSRRRHKCKSNSKTESESENELEQTSIVITRGEHRYWLSFLSPVLKGD